MGLAASQARFLAITARKMDCEFQSMQIAQDKLSITRAQQDASTEYQNALSATKLVWDTEDSTVYDLTFDTMMTPSVLNEYDAYILTDKTGKVVLSDTVTNSLKQAGLIDGSGQYIGLKFTQDGRDQFMEALGAAGAASCQNIENIKGKYYDKTAGLGGEPLDKTVANASTYNGYVNYMKDQEYTEAGKLIGVVSGGTTISFQDSSSTTDPKGSTIDSKVYALKLTDVLEQTSTSTVNYCNISGEYTDSSNKTQKMSSGNSGNIVIANNEDALSKSEVADLTVGDILSGEYTLASCYMSTENLKNYALKFLAAVGAAFGVGDTSYQVGLCVDDISYQALNYAYEATKNLLDDVTTTENGSGISGAINNAIAAAEDSNSIVKTKNSDGTAVSLTNLVKSFLTYFVMAIEGFDCGLSVGKETNNDDEQKSADKSTYISGSSDYSFVFNNDEAVTDTNELLADYYNQLYNQICTNGVCMDTTFQQNVTDSEYLSSYLKNGQLFISCINTDGYFYQGKYTDNGHVAEVEDTETITRAELEYEATKSRLNYKEESLDLELKNIDTELAALTTEYDTVKNLISKNVEKVFQMFQT